MPPPDTIYYYPQVNENLDTTGILEHLTKISTYPAHDSKVIVENSPREYWLELIVVGGIFVFFIFILKKVQGFFIHARKNIYRSQVQAVVVENGLVYHDWLIKSNPYYESLPKELKEVFIARMVSFMQSKQFHFHIIPEQEYIPVLISGAAIQLTFGLKNYLLDYFTDIHIMKKEYILSTDNETYNGHVSKTGIHISWRHFMYGYSNYSDSSNLGLHEMAHALQFDAYLGYECANDRNFKSRLNRFSEEGRPVFRAMRTGMGLFFDEYATTNFDEFWAVAVENFFENATAFKQQLPVLYSEMCQLLNQDPTTLYKIINRDRV
jgi:Mlc titration factor MtfA (ptsG expression regulator)